MFQSIRHRQEYYLCGSIKNSKKIEFNCPINYLSYRIKNIVTLTINKKSWPGEKSSHKFIEFAQIFSALFFTFFFIIITTSRLLLSPETTLRHVDK